MPDLCHGDWLDRPPLAVEMNQQLAVIARDFRQGGNDALGFFVRLLEIVN